MFVNVLGGRGEGGREGEGVRRSVCECFGWWWWWWKR